jgi:hypothetical protein
MRVPQHAIMEGHENEEGLFALNFVAPGRLEAGY